MLSTGTPSRCAHEHKPESGTVRRGIGGVVIAGDHTYTLRATAIPTATAGGRAGGVHFRRVVVIHGFVSIPTPLPYVTTQAVIPSSFDVLVPMACVPAPAFSERHAISPTVSLPA